MNNVMLDIETLSVSKNAAIISIGAVFFNPATGELGSEFYQTITQASCEAQGLEVDGDTLQWWSEQSFAARAVLFCPHATHIMSALGNFERFIFDNTPQNQHVEIWGNGASFDCAIVANAFRRCGFKLPWRYANERDVRTIVALGRELLQIDPKYAFPFVGTEHHALSDAKHQATYVSHIYQALAAKCAGDVNIKLAKAQAAKDAIYALFEAGNCPQSENGAGDGYIECGDALAFAERYAAQILNGGAV